MPLSSSDIRQLKALEIELISEVKVVSDATDTVINDLDQIGHEVCLGEPIYNYAQKMKNFIGGVRSYLSMITQE